MSARKTRPTSITLYVEALEDRFCLSTSQGGEIDPCREDVVAPVAECREIEQENDCSRGGDSDNSGHCGDNSGHCDDNRGNDCGSGTPDPNPPPTNPPPTNPPPTPNPPPTQNPPPVTVPNTPPPTSTPQVPTTDSAPPTSPRGVFDVEAVARVIDARMIAELEIHDEHVEHAVAVAQQQRATGAAETATARVAVAPVPSAGADAEEMRLTLPRGSNRAPVSLVNRPETAATPAPLTPEVVTRFFTREIERGQEHIQALLDGVEALTNSALSGVQSLDVNRLWYLFFATLGVSSVCFYWDARTRRRRELNPEERDWLSNEPRPWEKP